MGKSSVDNSQKIIGPFLGHSSAGSARIFIGLPFSRKSSLTCKLELFQEPKQRREHTAEAKSGEFKLFEFKFENLEPNKVYHYWFESDGCELALEGLGKEDCVFYAPAPFSEEESFILLSCHNPFEFQKKNPGSTGWEMWGKLLELLKSNPSIRLLLLAGDQVYCDDLESKHDTTFKSTSPESIENTKAELRKLFIEQYLQYWGDPTYRKVLARIPSLAIWDDHDITDGWGGRPEFWDSKEPNSIAEKWLSLIWRWATFPSPAPNYQK